MSLPPFQALLDSHGAVVHRFLVAAVGPVDADDCFQATCIAALRAYPALRDVADPRAWLLELAGERAGVDAADEPRLSADVRRHGGPSQKTLDRFAGRAGSAGLIDVAYGQADSPFGPLTVATTDAGLVLLAYPELELDGLLERLAQAVSPRVLAAPRRVEPIRRELDEYFAGRRREFTTPVDWRLVNGGFFEAILRATAEIGYGETVSYRDVAGRAGNAKAVRAAGNGLGSNPVPIVVPCHRVVASGGGLGGYTGGVERKQHLLALERGESAAA